MKLERSDYDYGSGSGYTVYESDVFRVVLWNMSKGVNTVIKFYYPLYNFKAVFDGKHDFKSDDECMEQLTALEILGYVRLCEEESFKKGRNSMRRDFNSLMGSKD